MKISNVEYINRSKFHSFDLEYNGQTYKIYVREMYHKDSNFTKRDVEVIPDCYATGKEPFFQEIEKYVIDNIDDILKVAQ